MSHMLEIETPALPPENLATTGGPDESRLEAGRRRAAKRAALGGVAVLALLVAAGSWIHVARNAAAHEALLQRQQMVPVVRTMLARANPGPREVELPGTMQAFDSAVLFARATGYIAKRQVDIGSQVHAGDVLAVIAAPDLDQQQAQARAQLAQMQAALVEAQANLQLATLTNRRTTRLVHEGWSSQQQGDTAQTTYDARMAALNVARANLAAQAARVQQLTELTGYEKVTAPFDGTITARQVDVGSLVTADAANNTPLFGIARSDKLRTQVYIPQEYVFGFKDGATATVTVPQLPGRVFHGTVSRNAQALNTDTRTLLAEVDIDNTDNVLTPGTYATVHLQQPRQNPAIMIPSEAVIFGKDGLSAAVLKDGKIEIRHLDIQADNGAQVEVRGGLNPGDRVILNPPVNATPGMAARQADQPG